MDVANPPHNPLESRGTAEQPSRVPAQMTTVDLARGSHTVSDAARSRPEPDGIYLYWIPLGAGGTGLVRLNGRIYEAYTARRERRSPLDLYHTALQVHLSSGRFVVETMWPSPNSAVEERGVVHEGPVFHRRLGTVRLFRYEVRRWRNGVLPDAGDAVGGPLHLSSDPTHGERLLALAEAVPPLVWGRDESRVGEMWNSNSVVSWLLARCGLPMSQIRPPAGGRAPGWDAGIALATGRGAEGARS